jgi:ATP-dependent 26S proteasome regulatory subunit
MFVFRGNKTLSQGTAALVNSPSACMPEAVALNVPKTRFADVGGFENAKEQIRQIVVPHLQPERSRPYGVLRNGILLYGPRGTGKTLLATATAGEFGLNFVHVSAPRLVNRWIGATGEHINATFDQAAGRKPALLFIDEVDSVGAGRQDPTGDPGGAGREFNNVTTALMSAVDPVDPSISITGRADLFSWPQLTVWTVWTKHCCGRAGT